MSVLRYIGGKAKLAKFITPYIKVPKRGVYCEPFVGGGNVALAIATKRSDIQIVLNDLDPEVATFWSVVSGSDKAQFLALVKRVAYCEPKIELFHEFQAAIPLDPVERAFRFLFLNRTSRVESHGKRPLGGWGQEKEGELSSRWASSRLVTQLTTARMALVDRTEVHNMDFAEVIALAQPNWALYCDPPYFEIGDTLYNISWTEDDHIRLRNALLFNPARWVLSYGDHPRIHDLYQHADIAVLEAHHGMKKRKSNELIITPRIS